MWDWVCIHVPPTPCSYGEISLSLMRAVGAVRLSPTGWRATALDADTRRATRAALPPAALVLPLSPSHAAGSCRLRPPV